jgi:mono/diheme cytochrome c family protein
MKPVWYAAIALALTGAAGAALFFPFEGQGSPADPNDAVQVALGKTVYDAQCALCHGANLEGQPNWQTRNANGRLPAPPHDASGHTWHHPDAVLFGITKNGIGAYAPAGYQSDMPAFGGVLSDAEIWAVLAYIKSRWPEDVRVKQEHITALAK